MDFLEDLSMYNEAMKNSYYLITKRKTLDAIDAFYLPFGPIEEDGRSIDIIDMVIDYFITTEEYEKCEELTKIKEKCLKTLIE